MGFGVKTIENVQLKNGQPLVLMTVIDQLFDLLISLPAHHITKGFVLLDAVQQLRVDAVAFSPEGVDGFVF